MSTDHMSTAAVPHLPPVPDHEHGPRGTNDPPSSLVEVLQRHAAAATSGDAAIFLHRGAVADRIASFADLDRSARAIAAALLARMQPGDRALLLYPPGLDFLRGLFGCLYAGIIAVPACLPKPNHSMARVEAIAADSGARAVLTTGHLCDDVDRVLAGATRLQPLIVTATDRVSGREDALNDARAWQPSIDRHTIAFLQYTSGTTSHPKGVIVTHGNILAHSEQAGVAWGFASNDTMVSWLPHYHDMGLIGTLTGVYHGMHNVMLSPLAFYQNPLRWLQAISTYRGTCSAAPNSAYELCARRVTDEEMATLDLSGWRTAVNGAETVRPATLERFADRFARCGFRRSAFRPSYGLAEATLGVATTDPAAAPTAEASVASCGRPLPGQQVRAVDPVAMSACADGDVGEIWVSGPNVARGYWNKPEDTAATFHARLADGSGPFLRTGDLGYLRNGEVYITGRRKDLIIVAGRNHYPQDIELTVEHCHPALRPFSGAAFAIVGADEEHLVVVHEIDRPSQIDDQDAIIAAIRRAVTAEHDLHAHAVALVKPGSIPRTSSGKIQRHACRDAFLAGRLRLAGAVEAS